MLVQEALDDLNKYVNMRGFILSEQARSVFKEAEELGCEQDSDIYPYIFLPAVIATYPELQRLMHKNSCDPDTALETCYEYISKNDDDEYASRLQPYSSKSDTRITIREGYIDNIITCTKKHRRKEIIKLDVLEGFLSWHDQESPASDNHMWRDSELHVPYNTLAHILGTYDKSLWLSFDEIRKQLNIYKKDVFRKIAIDAAPRRLKSTMLDFFSDFPDYQKNCFLIMSFKQTKFHREVHNFLKLILKKHGFNLLRADDRTYSNDLLANIETYIFGSKFAFAVHERVESDSHNANVSLEIGYFMGLGKEVCLLKEKNVHLLPSDLQGKLYVSFDMLDIKKTLTREVEDWLLNKRLISSL